jgi:ankyrin repeat protein
MRDQQYGRTVKGGPRMAEPSKIAEAFAQLTLVRDKEDAAALHLFDLCADNPEMMRAAAEAFAGIADMMTRWKERAREFGAKDDDPQRGGVRASDRPALMRAVIHNDPQKVAALIKAGVQLDETDEGETALHWAVSRRHTEIVVMLLDAGANPNVPDNDGYTPLHDIAEMEDCPPARMMLKALLAAGADPNLRESKNGWTPLHITVMSDDHDDLDIAEELLCGGADPTLRDFAGMTAAELAESTGYSVPVLPLSSFQTMLPQSPGSRAADDFAMIRARMKELRRDE